MNMVLSNYEMIFSLDDSHSLLVNGLYGAIDVVDRSEAEALSRGEFAKLSVEETERLKSRGHLTDSFESESEDLLFLTGIFRKCLIVGERSFFILPTYNCNFRCPYCFERHRLSCGEDWLKKTMSKEMVDSIFAAVEKEKKGGVKVPECRFYGGEPFLPENREIVEYIAKKAVAAGMTLSAVTNAYCLEYFSDILSGYPFKSLQITLDGPKEVNDRKRVSIDGNGSYEKILDNVSLALSKGIRVHLRINTGTDNLERVHELKQVFTERGFNGHTEFSYYFIPTYEGEDCGVSNTEIVENLVQNGFEIKEAMALVAHYNHTVTEIEALLEKRDYLKPSDVHCGAENMIYVVDREGALYTCPDLVATDEMRVGRINIDKEKFSYTFDLLKWNLRQVTRMPECMKCPYVFLCRGGCAAGAYRKTGDMTKQYCGETKEIFCRTVPMICGEHFRKTGEREMTKSLKEVILRYTPEERNTLMSSGDPKIVLQLLKKNNII